MQLPILKITNLNHEGDFKTFGDLRNQNFVFYWSPELECYAYQPKDQNEMDGVLELNWKAPFLPLKFGVVMASLTAAPQKNGLKQLAPLPAGTVPPYVRREVYEAYPLADLKALAEDVKLPDRQHDDTHRLIRELDAYFHGRGWAAEELKRQKARVTEMEQQLAAAKAAPQGSPAEALKKPQKARIYRKGAKPPSATKRPAAAKEPALVTA